LLGLDKYTHWVVYKEMVFTSSFMNNFHFFQTRAAGNKYATRTGAVKVRRIE